MDLLGALGVLVRVVETGSFSAVARERELSQAAVARQIAQLENHFAVRLLHRTTRTELDRRRTNAGGPRATGAGWRRNDGSCARQAARLTGGVGTGRHDSDREPPLFGPFSGLARRAPGAKGRTRGQRSLRRYGRGPARPCHTPRRDHGCVTRRAPARHRSVRSGGSTKLHRAERKTVYTRRSRKPPASSTTSDRTRTSGLLCLPKAPRVSRCPADFSPMT